MADLFHSNWNTATGSAENTIEDQAKWQMSGDHNATYIWYTVSANTGGDTPGGRNYISAFRKPSGNSDLLNPEANSMADSSDVYIRLWIKINSGWGGSLIEHFMNLTYSWWNDGNGGIWYVDVRGGQLGIQPHGQGIWQYTGDSLLDDTWHLWELHIANCGSGSGNAVISVKLDGADVSSSIEREGVNLTETTFTIPYLRHQYNQMYDSGGNDVKLCDMAGLKISNSEWIGAIQKVNGVYCRGLSKFCGVYCKDISKASGRHW